VALSFKNAGIENTFYWYVTVMMAVAFLFSLRLPKQPAYLHEDH
jgi:MHS family dicarboxylic acid transporter PcaT-like MFS transporter